MKRSKENIAFDLSSLYFAFVISLLIAVALHFLIYQQLYFFEIILGWLIIGINYACTCVIRRRAVGKDVAQFMKYAFGYNGAKFLFLLGFIFLVLMQGDISVYPFVTSIFAAYIACILTDLFNLYFKHLRQSAH